MRIATSIDRTMIRQFFTGFFTSKKTVILLIVMFASYAIYDFIEWQHYSHLRGDDKFFVHWGWAITTPMAIWWLWAEVKRKYSQQFAAGLLFLFLGPALAMGTELRNLSTFSATERWEMLACMFVGGISFFVYIRAKWFQS